MFERRKSLRGTMKRSSLKFGTLKFERRNTKKYTHKSSLRSAIGLNLNLNTNNVENVESVFNFGSKKEDEINEVQIIRPKRLENPTQPRIAFDENIMNLNQNNNN